jgi:hypothetical protein
MKVGTSDDERLGILMKKILGYSDGQKLGK